MANVKLKAIHAIYRKEGGKQVRIEPGKPFTCPEKEAQDEDYVGKGAAEAVEVEAEKAPTKQAAVKKTAAKKPAGKAGDSGNSNDDDPLA